MRSAYQATLHILAGRTADGAAPLARKVAFTRNLAIRQIFATQMARLAQGVEERLRRPLTGDELTAIICKCANHCSRAGWQTSASLTPLLRLVPVLIDAFAAHPRRITDPVNLPAILTAHHQVQPRLEKERIRAREAQYPPPVCEGWADPPFSVVELKTADHLRYESACLGHCAGTLYDQDLLSARHLTPFDPGADNCLALLAMMQSGETRLFSFRRDGRPLATIEYGTATRRLEQIHMRDGSFRKPPPYFPHLCRALHTLAQHMRVTAIGRLHLADRHVLTCDGSIVPFEAADPTDIIVGWAAATDTTPVDVLTAMAAHPRMTLDITYLGNRSRLPPTVAAALRTTSLPSRPVDAGTLASLAANPFLPER